MKRILGLLLIASAILVSCSKKTHPAVSNSSKTPRPDSHTGTVTEPPASATNPPESIPLPAGAIPAPMIVIDERGNIVTSRDKLPEDIAAKVDYGKITRSFTPVQRKNLIYRFKMVPPRVLYVPGQLASKTAKGYYCVFKKKFWYWKKEDGLFHLDETYYQ